MPHGWWNAELDEISKTVRRLQEKTKQNPSNAGLTEEARKARNPRRNASRTAKQSDMMLKLQTTGPADIRKINKKATPTHVKAILNFNDQAEFEAKCKALYQALVPIPNSRR